MGEYCPTSESSMRDMAGVQKHDGPGLEGDKRQVYEESRDPTAGQGQGQGQAPPLTPPPSLSLSLSPSTPAHTVTVTLTATATAHTSQSFQSTSHHAQLSSNQPSVNVGIGMIGIGVARLRPRDPHPRPFETYLSHTAAPANANIVNANVNGNVTAMSATSAPLAQAFDAPSYSHSHATPPPSHAVPEQSHSHSRSHSHSHSQAMGQQIVSVGGMSADSGAVNHRASGSAGATFSSSSSLSSAEIGVGEPASPRSFRPNQSTSSHPPHHPPPPITPPLHHRLGSSVPSLGLGGSALSHTATGGAPRPTTTVSRSLSSSLSASCSRHASPLISPTGPHGASTGGHMPSMSLAGGGIPLPDFSGMDSVRHQSPAQRSRAINPRRYQSRSLHGTPQQAPIPIPMHQHSEWLNSSSGHLALSSPALGLWGASSFTSHSSCPSGASTPQRNNKRRMNDRERGELERPVKLFTFLSRQLERMCRAHDDDDVGVGGMYMEQQRHPLQSDDSYSILRQKNHSKHPKSMNSLNASSTSSSSSPPSNHTFGLGGIGSEHGVASLNSRPLGTASASSTSAPVTPARTACLLGELAAANATGSTIGAAATGPPFSSPASHLAIGFSSGFAPFTLSSAPTPPLRPSQQHHAPSHAHSSSLPHPPSPPTPPLHAPSSTSTSTSTSTCTPSILSANPSMLPCAAFSRVGHSSSHMNGSAVLGQGSFGDVIRARVSRRAFVEAHFPTNCNDMESEQTHIGETNDERRSDIKLEFALKKSRMPFRTLAARHRTLYQFDLLHTLLLHPPTPYIDPLYGGDVPASLEWHPHLLQLHAIWQEEGGWIVECMERCTLDPNGSSSSRGDDEDDDSSSWESEQREMMLRKRAGDMEEYFLAFTAQAHGQDGSIQTMSSTQAQPAEQQAPAAVGILQQLQSESDSGYRTPPGQRRPSLIGAGEISGVGMESTVDMCDDEAADADEDGETSSGNFSMARSLPVFPLRSPMAEHSTSINESDHVSPSALHPTEVELYRLMAQIGGALCYMHAAGMLHFDVKPSNIFATVSPHRTPSLDQLSSSSPSGVASSMLHAGPTFKLGDYGSIVSIRDYICGEASSSDEGDGDFLAPEVLNPIPGCRLRIGEVPNTGRGVYHSLASGNMQRAGGGGLSGLFRQFPSTASGSGSGSVSGSSNDMEDEPCTITSSSSCDESDLQRRIKIASDLAPAVDVYSFGMSLYAIMTGQLRRHRAPLLAADSSEIEDSMDASSHTHSETDAFPPTLFPCSSFLQSLVLRMLDPDPHARPPMREVVQSAMDGWKEWEKGGRKTCISMPTVLAKYNHPTHASSSVNTPEHNVQKASTTAPEQIPAASTSTSTPTPANGSMTTTTSSALAQLVRSSLPDSTPMHIETSAVVAATTPTKQTSPQRRLSITISPKFRFGQAKEPASAGSTTTARTNNTIVGHADTLPVSSQSAALPRSPAILHGHSHNQTAATVPPSPTFSPRSPPALRTKAGTSAPRRLFQAAAHTHSPPTPHKGVAGQGIVGQPLPGSNGSSSNGSTASSGRSSRSPSGSSFGGIRAGFPLSASVRISAHQPLATGPGNHSPRMRHSSSQHNLRSSLSAAVSSVAGSICGSNPVSECASLSVSGGSSLAPSPNCVSASVSPLLQSMSSDLRISAPCSGTATIGSVPSPLVMSMSSMAGNGTGPSAAARSGRAASGVGAGGAGPGKSYSSLTMPTFNLAAAAAASAAVVPSPSAHAPGASSPIRCMLSSGEGGLSAAHPNAHSTPRKRSSLHIAHNHHARLAASRTAQRSHSLCTPTTLNVSSDTAEQTEPTFAVPMPIKRQAQEFIHGRAHQPTPPPATASPDPAIPANQASNEFERTSASLSSSG